MAFRYRYKFKVGDIIKCKHHAHKEGLTGEVTNRRCNKYSITLLDVNTGFSHIKMSRSYVEDAYDLDPTYAVNKLLGGG